MTPAVQSGERQIVMKVLMICGSARKASNSSLALDEMKKIFESEGIDAETVTVGKDAVHGCIGCGACKKTGRCINDDGLYELADRFEAADALVIASPVHYASAPGALIAMLDRLFYSTKFDKTMKVGAALAVARRSGTTATFDELNKYFAISGMPIATSQYWNTLHGAAPGETAQDGEGLQTARTLARNIVFLMKSIALGKEKYGLPEKEAPIRTNFIR